MNNSDGCFNKTHLIHLKSDSFCISNDFKGRNLTFSQQQQKVLKINKDIYYYDNINIWREEGTRVCVTKKPQLWLKESRPGTTWSYHKTQEKINSKSGNDGSRDLSSHIWNISEITCKKLWIVFWIQSYLKAKKAQLVWRWWFVH